MNRTLAFGTLAACLALVGTGCSRSPRVTFYTLEPAARLESAVGTTATPTTSMPTTPAAAAAPTALFPSSTAASAAGAHAGPATAASVVVGPVTLPELVDRPQLVVRVAPNRVAILESERWAEPLRSQIPRVIAEDLARLLGSSQVASYLQHSGPEAGCRVLLDIERFEASPGEAVSVEAVWSLRRAPGGGPMTGRSRVREAAAGEGYDALIAAYGRALLAVSADLARALRAEGAGGK